MTGLAQRFPRASSEPPTVRQPGNASPSWLLPQPLDAPQDVLTLICFPHAGAGPGVYRPFAQQLLPELATRLVHLPGRESRIDEPALESVPAVVQALLPRLLPELPGRFALWGHSMGGFVAFETARLLETRYGLQAEALVVSGCQAPRSPGRSDLLQRHLLNDDELWHSAAALGGIPREVFRSPELRAMLLPTLRADFAVFETYERRAGPTLGCSVHAFGGRSDPEASCADMRGWGRETRGEFHLTELPGGHFFPLDDPEAFASVLVPALRGD